MELLAGLLIGMAICIFYKSYKRMGKWLYMYVKDYMYVDKVTRKERRDYQINKIRAKLARKQARMDDRMDRLSKRYPVGKFPLREAQDAPLDPDPTPPAE